MQRDIGLVLSGGGARGAYQAGVCLALLENGFGDRLHTIAGTSIGAINAAMIIQDLESTGNNLIQQIWEETEPGKIFTVIPEGVEVPGLKEYRKLVGDWLSHFHLRIDPLKERLHLLLKEAIIRRSPIQMRLNTWNVLKFRSENYDLQSIPEGKLEDYILASASFPIFGTYQIGSEYYLDGGIGSNLPVHLLMEVPSIRLGISIDVATYMRFRPSQLYQEFTYRNKVFFIRPSRSIPSPVNFSRKAVRMMLEVGYDDGLRNLPGIRQLEEELSLFEK